MIWIAFVYLQKRTACRTPVTILLMIYLLLKFFSSGGSSLRTLRDSATGSWEQWPSRCQQDPTSVNNHPRRSFHNGLHPITTSEPFQILGADIVGRLPSTDEGYQYFIMFVDYFSNYVRLSESQFLSQEFKRFLEATTFYHQQTNSKTERTIHILGMSGATR